MIQALILADSVCTTRLTTFLVVAPRIILAEINTHCMLPKNSASSRAIPVEKRIKQVQQNPFTPRFLGANKAGMQADVALGGDEAECADYIWQEAVKDATRHATTLAALGLHKQIANRILEPYTWCSTIITGTEWGNFFNLRVHEDAQPEFFELAGQMLSAYHGSTPVELTHGEWHIPFHERMPADLSESDRLKVSAARCARLSYEALADGNTYNSLLREQITRDLALFEKLEQSGHASPFQHQAQAVDSNTWSEACPETGEHYILQQENALWDGKDVWWAQLRWWRMFRKTLRGENRTRFDPESLLATWRRVRAERGYV